jgi:MoaA/NifB/PqqE/SkfB family radical SAM enzyme
MIKETMSLCEICYRHIPAYRFERGRELWISKTCPEHGMSEHMIEREKIFQETIKHHPECYDAGGYVLEVTDRCNLTCPHCYQEPDNKKIDKSIDSIIDQINSFPDDGYSVTLAGAEPTMRTDLCELITAIKTRTNRELNVLTNGLKLSSIEFCKDLIAAGCEFVTIGLNHPDYQGEAIHKKQLRAIENCNTLGLRIKNINYTLSSIDQIPFILEEIQTFKDFVEEFRIRGGADIGRCPDEPRLYLSELVHEVYRQVIKLNYKWEKVLADDNIYHYMVKINGATHRIIQWADAKTVDLDELQCGPWGSFVPGVPPTNLMHQVMLRDAVINKGMKLQDNVPVNYQRI